MVRGAETGWFVRCPLTAAWHVLAACGQDCGSNCRQRTSRSLSCLAGKLIYDQLGSSAEGAFVRDWMTAFGMEQGSAFKEMLEEIGKAMLIILILDKLWVQKNEPWCAR